MISIYIVVSVVIFGFLISQMTCISYIKSIRNNSKIKMNIKHVIALCSILGGPALLISYASSEIRDEDILNNRLWLIVGIISTIIEIIILILLFSLNVVKFE